MKTEYRIWANIVCLAAIVAYCLQLIIHTYEIPLCIHVVTAFCIGWGLRDTLAPIDEGAGENEQE